MEISPGYRKIRSKEKMGRLETKRRMKGLMMFLPNMLGLCGRLMTDKRVPRAERALFAGAIIYAIVPLDFIPDVLPFIGQVDDVYLIALTLLRLINRTDEDVVRQHWRGGGDVIQLAESLASIAPLLLPKRIHRALTSRVEVAPSKDEKGGLRAAGKASPTLVEVPEPEESRA
jgi:uncharacterized membrane protein YkvA (DUF1232 family)